MTLIQLEDQVGEKLLKSTPLYTVGDKTLTMFFEFIMISL